MKSQNWGKLKGAMRNGAYDDAVAINAENEHIVRRTRLKFTCVTAVVFFSSLTMGMTWYSAMQEPLQQAGSRGVHAAAVRAATVVETAAAGAVAAAGMVEALLRAPLISTASNGVTVANDTTVTRLLHSVYVNDSSTALFAASNADATLVAAMAAQLRRWPFLRALHVLGADGSATFAALDMQSGIPHVHVSRRASAPAAAAAGAPSRRGTRSCSSVPLAAAAARSFRRAALDAACGSIVPSPSVVLPDTADETDWWRAGRAEAALAAEARRRCGALALEASVGVTWRMAGDGSSLVAAVLPVEAAPSFPIGNSTPCAAAMTPVPFASVAEASAHAPNLTPPALVVAILDAGAVAADVAETIVAPASATPTIAQRSKRRWRRGCSSRLGSCTSHNSNACRRR